MPLAVSTASVSSAEAGARHRGIAWLAPLQWATVAVLWLATLAALVLPRGGLSLQTVTPALVGAAACRTAVALLLQRGRSTPSALRATSLAADALLMTGLLDITGGPFNPFIVMFVVYVWLAHASISTKWAVVVGIVALVGGGWLVIDHLNVQAAEHHALNDFPTHLFTMWLSGATVAELVAHYVTRARAMLATRQQQLDEARERAVRSEHLAALTTLAAGAAHELSTPLGTIAVAARELERRAGTLATTLPQIAPLCDDASLIREEVDRCQLILDGMSGRAPAGGSALGEPLSAGAIAELVRARLSEPQQRRLEMLVPSGLPMPAVSGPGMAQTISTLLKNAFEASPADAGVALRFSQQGAMVRVEVVDRGDGMNEEVLNRVGQPFYSTKIDGRGMGLGVFLARAFAEQAGGSLHFDVRDGTTAVLDVPAIVTAGEMR